jgi:5-methylcytosine-specific restriction endonuclease McrA
MADSTAFLFDDVMGSKVCTACGIEKPLSAFSPKVVRSRKDIKDGYSTVCLECDNEYHKARRRSDPEPYRAKDAKYQQTHADNRKANGHRRRAREMNAAGSVTENDYRVIRAGQTDKKGRLICWRCGKPITDTPHVDHWIPLSKGGSNDAGNLRYMHANCNISKGAKMPAEIGRLL